MTTEIFEDRDYLNSVYTNEVQVWYSKAIKELNQIQINLIAAGSIIKVEDNITMKFASHFSCNYCSAFGCTKKTTSSIGVDGNGPNASIAVKSVAYETAFDSGCNLEYNENDDRTESIKLVCDFFGIFLCNSGY